jgi:tungstate transport system substrate-binding protein
MVAALIGLIATDAAAEAPFITVASTTSTRNSGLYDHLLPQFTAATGIEVRVVAVGTGQAIRVARSGDADILLVHHKPSEETFVADGFGVARFDVMYNDFVIVGPTDDIANVRGMDSAVEAFGRIAESQSVFVSRGDDSGTHKKEIGIWRAAGVDVAGASGQWYRETGAGMGATLNTAAGMNAYALTDRGTWLKFANKGELDMLVAGGERLFNQYGVILVDAARYPHIKSALGQRFIDWLLSDAGQAAINAYTIDGEQAFFANARGGAQ